MKAVVVYESLWGDTKQIAEAIAAGIGQDTPALSTAEADAAALSNVMLLVAGAPSHYNKLSSEKSRATAAERADADPDLPAPDLSHPSVDEWLLTVPRGIGYAAGFDTRSAGFWASGPAAKILKRLRAAGYRPAGRPEGFIVSGQAGPLADGELERACAWGEALAAVARGR